MNNNFEKYSDYYDLLYEDKQYEQEIDYVISLLDGGEKKETILEFGCGTGKYSSLLVEKGYSVHGIDISEAMIKKVPLHPRLSVEVNNVCDVTLNKTFDVFLGLFHVFSYLTLNDQLAKFFANAHKHLNKNGLLIFDCWYTPAVLTIKPSLRVKKASNDKVDVTRVATPHIIENENIIKVHYDLFCQNKDDMNSTEYSEDHYMRYFSMPEINNYAEIYGFTVEKCEELLTSNIPSMNTFAVCFKLRKN